MDVTFLEDSRGVPGVSQASTLTQCWKIIVAYDNPALHRIARVAVDNHHYLGRSVEILSAYSAREAIRLVKDHPDTAVLLLDMLMEHEESGVDVVTEVRDVLDNWAVRIVLRADKSRSTRARDLASRYDISHCLTKSAADLAQIGRRMPGWLRTFEILASAHSSKRALEKIIEVSQPAALALTPNQFADGVLRQLDSLVDEPQKVRSSGDKSARRGSLAASGRFADDLIVTAATGEFKRALGRDLMSMLTPLGRDTLLEGLKLQRASYLTDSYVATHRGKRSQKVLIVADLAGLPKVDKKVLDVFFQHFAVTCENLELSNSIDSAQIEIAYRLGGAVESRSKETSGHIKRVANMSETIGRAYGMRDDDAIVLKHASPLHDVGKIGIPDHILNKPGKHTPEEREIMRTHAQIGFDLLDGSDQEILQVGGVIALEHHERWDGGGYPHRKQGLEISLPSRIVAAIDVFDALGSQRCYKEPWSIDRITELFQLERGGHFEPRVVDLIFDRMDELLAIQKQYPD